MAWATVQRLRGTEEVVPPTRSRDIPGSIFCGRDASATNATIGSNPVSRWTVPVVCPVASGPARQRTALPTRFTPLYRRPDAGQAEHWLTEL